MFRKNCITIISTNYIAPEYANGTHLMNYRDHFKINMINLQKKDSGLYQCGIGNDNSQFFYPINVKVSEGDKIPYSSEVIVAHLKGSIIINCPVPQEFNTRWKYLCKMGTMGVPSCHTMVNSSGYVHQNFLKRVLIQEISNTSDFKILVNNIERNDFGFYRCGTGKYVDGSNWTDVHIHILNPSNKIRYQITKPLNRYPGELVITQCRIPISFNSDSRIYWCRWNKTGCMRLIDNAGFVQEGFQNRIFLNNTNRIFTITLNHLELGDTGCYWCIITDGQNVETSSVEIYILGIDHSENITPFTTDQLPGTAENNETTPVYMLNSKVTILQGNSTLDPQSKPGQNNSSYQSNVSSPKNLILILILVLAITFVIGFATLIPILIKARKKRDTINSVLRQENFLMINEGSARQENDEEDETSIVALIRHSNNGGETATINSVFLQKNVSMMDKGAAGEEKVEGKEMKELTNNGNLFRETEV
ncbi:polymeric immunoglobulin receptor-like [Dendrobates tinctorius]|uniref:polymeric immunoglobulin receptor-like n=1 Tax=Dendrobates tinctorius TaxID=92724 RepID=UPI003CCA2C67